VSSPKEEAAEAESAPGGWI